jgi:hypothetical protein
MILTIFIKLYIRVISDEGSLAIAFLLADPPVDGYCCEHIKKEILAALYGLCIGVNGFISRYQYLNYGSKMQRIYRRVSVKVELGL